MGNIFAASEIVELGIQIEKNGEAFYRALSERAKAPKAAEMFSYLAGEEKKHITAFRKILEKAEKYVPPQAYADEYLAYMNALASDHVFTQANKGEELARQATGDKEAVGLGIKLEKDSIIFYEGMKKVVPAHDLKIIDELILQEQSHLRQLSDFRKGMSCPGA